MSSRNNAICDPVDQRLGRVASGAASGDESVVAAEGTTSHQFFGREPKFHGSVRGDAESIGHHQCRRHRLD
jgi:hypothetical protein